MERGLITVDWDRRWGDIIYCLREGDIPRENECVPFSGHVGLAGISGPIFLGRSSMKTVFRLFLAASLMALFAVSASAQLSKGFKGKVLDREGKPAVGVTVTFQDKSTKANRYETKTDEKGHYVYAGLPYSQDGYFISVKVGDLPEVQRLEKVKILDAVEVNFDMKKDIQVQEIKANPAAEAQDLYKLEDYEGALKKADQAILEGDNLKAAKFMKAACLLKLGRLDESAQAFEAYDVLYPGNVDVLGQLADLYDKKGDKEKADKYKKAFKEKGGQILGDTYNQGVAAFNSGDAKKAAELFQSAIKEDPADAEAHRELSKAYAQMGKYSLAVQELRTYLKMRPDAPDKDMWEQAIPTLSKLKDTN